MYCLKKRAVFKNGPYTVIYGATCLKYKVSVEKYNDITGQNVKYYEIPERWK